MLELKLYDTIGGWGISADAFVSQIPADATEITLRINSPGGDVADGLAMYNYLKDHPAHVTTIVDGYAASAASVVMLAGDEIKVHKSSIVMVHNPWTMAVGNSEELRKTADVLDEHGKAILDIYQDATGLPESELAELMQAETWMRGQAAIDYGFASSLIEDEKAENRAAAFAAWSHMIGALQEGRELSATNKLKAAIDRAEQAESKLAEVEKIKAQANAEIEKAQAAVEEIKASHAEALASVQAEIAGLRDQVAALESDVSAKVAEVEALTGQVAERDVIVAELSKKLENPAYDDASLQNAAKLAQSQADAEADAAEAKALEQEQAKADAEKPSFAKWQSIEDAKEKRRYYLAHRAEILASMEDEVKEDNDNA